MTKIGKIINYWNKDGLCSKDSPTSHADPFLVKIDNYFETRQLSDFIMGLSTKERTLDIGAGYGRLSKVLAEQFKHVVALEGADKIFAVLQQEMKPFDNAVSVRGSFEDLADKWEKKFELILASGILYLYDDEMVNSFFEAVKKNLSPNGTLILRDFVVKGEKIYKKSGYVEGGSCYYRNQNFWNELAERYNMNVYKYVKSKPDLSLLRNPRIVKIINFFGLSKFILRKIETAKIYDRFVNTTRESFTKENNIYTAFIVIKNA